MDIDYSKELMQSVREGIKLGLDSTRLDQMQPSEQEISEITALCKGSIHELLLRKHSGQYWGDQCLNLASQAYLCLKYKGYDCDIVFGDVRVGGVTYEFDTTLEGLRKEYKKGTGQGGMEIHAWVAVGDKLVIDYSMAARLNHFYDKNVDPLMPFICSPEELKRLKLEYIPMLTGAQFLTVTCGINPLGALVEEG
jgi:hypothetical protein